MTDTQRAAEALPNRDPNKPNEQQGLYGKFEIHRADGRDAPGGKHHGCDYFVLDVTHDKYAAAALASYATACESTHPQLAADMRNRYGLASPAIAPEAPGFNYGQFLIERATGHYYRYEGERGGQAILYKLDSYPPHYWSMVPSMVPRKFRAPETDKPTAQQGAPEAPARLQGVELRDVILSTLRLVLDEVDEPKAYRQAIIEGMARRIQVPASPPTAQQGAPYATIINSPSAAFPRLRVSDNADAAPPNVYLPEPSTTQQCELSDAEIEALAHRRCRTYKHIDDAVRGGASYTFDAASLNEFARAVIAADRLRRVNAANGWHQAIDDALVSAGLDCTSPAESPRDAIKRLVAWETQIALDPAVSSAAAELAAEADATNAAQAARIAALEAENEALVEAMEDIGRADMTTRGFNMMAEDALAARAAGTTGSGRAEG